MGKDFIMEGEDNSISDEKFRVIAYKKTVLWFLSFYMKTDI